MKHFPSNCRWLGIGWAEVGLCLSVVLGADNERGRGSMVIRCAALPQIQLPPSEDRNGMCSVPAELRPMSSFSVSRDGTPYPERSACVVFVTFGPARVILCVKSPCDIMYIIISTGLQLNTGMKSKCKLLVQAVVFTHTL